MNDVSPVKLRDRARSDLAYGHTPDEVRRTLIGLGATERVADEMLAAELAERHGRFAQRGIRNLAIAAGLYAVILIGFAAGWFNFRPHSVLLWGAIVVPATYYLAMGIGRLWFRGDHEGIESDL